MEHPDAPEGKGRKYARPELERRFLLRSRPAGEPTRRVRIHDRYLSGTRLRLRAETNLADGVVVYKLGQKLPRPDGRPGLITNIYLSEAEYAVLATVSARSLRKRRSSYPPFGVDEFEGELAGLILAEAEFDTEAEHDACVPPPEFDVVAEVTGDPELTGGQFATMTRDELRRALERYAILLEDPASEPTVG